MFGLKNTKANRLEARKAYIPENAFAKEFPELETVVYTYESNGRPYALAFVGTAGKPAFHYYYRSEEKRLEAIRKFIADRRKLMEYKAERKAQNKGTLTGSAATAKAIRTRLKKEFPGVKFSVTSDNFSGGNSVHIKWTDGPVTSVVATITRQYQYGWFDGMTDSYNYCKIDEESLGCPGAKYVQTHRSQSEERKAELKAHCMEKYGRIIEQFAQGTQFNAWYYENNERDTWKDEYREIIEVQERKQYEAEQAERQSYLAELKAKEEQEARLEAEKSSPKVVSLADHKRAKQEKLEAQSKRKTKSEESELFESVVLLAKLLLDDISKKPKSGE